MFKLNILRQNDLIIQMKNEVIFVLKIEENKKRKISKRNFTFFLLSEFPHRDEALGSFFQLRRIFIRLLIVLLLKSSTSSRASPEVEKNLQERLENKFCPMLAGSLQTLNKFTLKLGLPRHKGGYYCSLGQFDGVSPVTKIHICMNYSRRR